MLETKNFEEQHKNSSFLSVFDILYFEKQISNSTFYPNEKELKFEINNSFKKCHKPKETLTAFKKRFYDGIIYVDNDKNFIGALIKK